MLRKIALASLALLLLWAMTSPAKAGDDCAVSAVEREELLTLPFQQFDQQHDSGWRPLYERGCHMEAALLLKEYVERHPDTAREQYMLAFHTGQLLALAGKRTEAIAWMEKGYSKTQSSMIDWDAFVDANIAFLRREFEQLLKQRARINRQPGMPAQAGVPEWAVGKKMNLDVVDGFIACFEEPYAVAYGEDCRQRGEKSAADSSTSPQVDPGEMDFQG